MRAVLQRASKGSVSVDGKLISEIQHGFVILLGVGSEDTTASAVDLAKKTANLRVFEDELGKMNLSILVKGGSILVISQFTLYAETHKGNRPSFIKAAPPDVAAKLVDIFCDELRKFGVPTSQGVFGAHMMVDLINDGPVTIILETSSQKS